MAKLKLTNKTTNNFWLAGYCFVPGETTTDELTLDEEIKLKKIIEVPSVADRVKAGKITFSFLGKSKIKKTTEDTAEITEEKTEGDGGLI